MNDSAEKSHTVPMSAGAVTTATTCPLSSFGAAGRASVPTWLTAGNDMLFEFKIRPAIPTRLTT
jgi:hypothetical protein